MPVKPSGPRAFTGATTLLYAIVMSHLETYSQRKMSKKIPIYYSLPVIIFSALLVAAVVYAWTEPTVAPPGGNVSPPLNVGSTGQSKAGGLILNTGGAVTGLIVDKGNVGIGTTNPQKKLHVSDYNLNLTSANTIGGEEILTEGNDSGIGIYSLRSSTCSSHLALAEINTNGTFSDTWSITRRANVNAGFPNSDGSFRIGYLTTPSGCPSDAQSYLTILRNGNVGIGTTNPQSPAPNSQSGNLDVNDVYLRSSGQWASQLYTEGAGGAGVYSCPNAGSIDCGTCKGQLQLGTSCQSCSVNENGECYGCVTKSCSYVGELMPPSVSIELNSASGLSCNQVCAAEGLICASIGIDTDASDKKGWNYWSYTGCINFSGGTCSDVMTNKDVTCSGHTTMWTYCRCE